MRCKLALLVASALILLASPAGAQESSQCRALDALGKPIPNAVIQTWRFGFLSRILGWPDFKPPPKDIETSTTDEKGNFALPRSTTDSGIMVRLLHPDYGIAETSFGSHRLSQPDSLSFPLVKKGDEAAAGALRGVVLDPEDKPVAGAEVQISRVWAMGNWLDIAGTSDTTVFTDKTGRFTICGTNGTEGYAWMEKTDWGKSPPVPAGSWYEITVVQPDFALFPDFGIYRNSKKAVIHLVRPEKFHRFTFIGADGEPIVDLGPRDYFRLSVVNGPAGEEISLPARFRTDRLKLPPGRYKASDGPWLASTAEITVTPDSPEELVVRFAPLRSFSGCVVDGVTGKPRAGAFVMLGQKENEDLLASLTAKDWQDLRALNDSPDVETDPIPSQIKRLISSAPLVRTDVDGRYAFKDRVGRYPGQWLAVFDEGQLPLWISTRKLKSDKSGHSDVPDAPLFPAARILVKSPKPAAGEADPSGEFVDCNWLIERDGQPDWFARFPPQRTSSFEEPVWHYPNTIGLRPSAEPAHLVPAGLKLRLRFVDYYGFVRDYAEPILLEGGQGKEIEDLSLPAVIEFSVRAADARGKPLAWIGVQQTFEGNEHKETRFTDANGVAKFSAQPGSKGRLSVKALQERLPAAERTNAGVAFSIPANAAEAPKKPHVITLTDEQIKLLSELPPPKE